MGRGRAKAKQTKVARELKYHTPSTDFDALQRELSDPDSGPFAHHVVRDEDDDPTDPGSADSDEDDDTWVPARR